MPSQTQLRPCVLRCGASGFAVDYWGHSSCVGAVFLTHAHSDHLCGLDGEWAPNGRTVFCSAITKALVLRKFPALAKRADVKIVALSQGTPTVVRLPDRSSGTLKNSKALLATLLPVSDYEKQTDTLLTVTALDAGHCPGSVSFLFEGDCGRVFHTGDWRREDWCGKGGLLGYGDGDGEKHGIGEDKPGIREQSDRKSYQCTTLPRCLTTRPIDLLLLDNTYGDEAYAFPSRKDAAATIVDLIRNKYPAHDIFVGIDSLGKEPLLARIARAIGEPIRVTPERHESVVCAWDAAVGAMEGAFGGGDGLLGDEDEDKDEDETKTETETKTKTKTETKTKTGGEKSKNKNPLFDPFLGACDAKFVLTSSSTSRCRVFAVPKQRVTRAKLAKIQESTGRRCVGILPTGWAGSVGDSRTEPSAQSGRKKTHPNKFAEQVVRAKSEAASSGTIVAYGAAYVVRAGVATSVPSASNELTENSDCLPPVHAVPYSLHAPYDELRCFVKALKPLAVVGNTRLSNAAGAYSIDVTKHFAAFLSDGARVTGGGGVARVKQTVSNECVWDTKQVSPSCSRDGNRRRDVTRHEPPERNVAPQSGHRVSHAFNGVAGNERFGRMGIQSTVRADESARLATKPLRLKRSVEGFRAAGDVLGGEPRYAVPNETSGDATETERAGKGAGTRNTGTCSSEPLPFDKNKKRTAGPPCQDSNRDREPNESVTTVTLTKTYVAAVSTLLRSFSKRKRRETAAGGENTRDASTRGKKTTPKERKHVPRWVTNVAG